MLPPPAVLNSLKWRKAKKSVGNGACVEVARYQDKLLLRDSDDPNGAIVTCTLTTFGVFLHGAKAGEFDDLL